MAGATAAGARRGRSGGAGCRAGRPRRGTRRAARPSGPRPKHGLGPKLAESAGARPGARLQPRGAGGARGGQEGRTCRRRHERGARPPGPTGERFGGLGLFAAGRPGPGPALAPAPPVANAPATGPSLGPSARRSEPGARAVLVLVPGRAGRHGEQGRRAPETLTLLPLPPHSPELVERRRCPTVGRVWLRLRGRLLSLRVLACHPAVLAAACAARDALAEEPGRLASLTACPYPAQV
jgi:hypothetical protein